MRFQFTDDQRLFQQSVREFLAHECTPEQVRAAWATDSGRSPARWAKLAELGVLGMLAPEASGGLGMSEVDLVLVLEEAGRAALPEPLAETVAIGVPLLRDLGGTLAAEWLPQIAAGRAIVTVGHPVNPFVADAHVADLVLLPHADELHAVPRAALRLTAQPVADPARRLFLVEWAPARDTQVAKGARAVALLAGALDRGALAAAAAQLGVAQQCVDLAVAYAKQREQFGRPIGSFQAIKHLLATVAVRIEFARPVVYRAAYAVAHDQPERPVAVSHAKVAASEAARAAAKTALQVHGAIGYTWECDLHIWMKRAWTLDLAWGTSAWHRARVGATLLAPDAPVLSFGYEAAMPPPASSPTRGEDRIGKGG
jgi:alkylation response protein AidB-like acyl-CoA dehydrogenase